MKNERIMKQSSWKTHCYVMLIVSLMTVLGIEPAAGATTSDKPAQYDTLQAIFERVERDNKNDVQRYQQLKSRKQSKLSEVSDQVNTQRYQLKMLNQSNGQLEEELLKLQQKLHDKQKQVEAARAGIVEVIDLTAAQQRNFVANNTP